MERDKYMPILLLDFEEWYKNDLHSKYENWYIDTLTEENITSLSKEEFVNFFYDFVAVGGKVQSGGERTKNKFKHETLASNEDFYAYQRGSWKLNFSVVTLSKSDYFNLCLK